MASNYWEQRARADEARAAAIADRASEEMAKMYRQQYLRVVKQIDLLKADIDYGAELSRTQLWNYARWRKVEEALREYVQEATRIDTQIIHDALDAEFERVIGGKAADYGGALGLGDALQLRATDKQRILAGTWSGEHYSARVWKNTSALAERMRNEITQMLVDGKSTQDIRRKIMREFDVSFNNADRLVRTEVSYVHNQSTLAQYKSEGIQQVQVLAEESACEQCRELPGKPYDIDSAPFIPVHPRCRCCYAAWTYIERKKWAQEHPEEAERAAKEEEAGRTQEVQQEAPKPLQNQGNSGIIEGEQSDEEIQKLIRSNATNKKVDRKKQAIHLRDSGEYIEGRSPVYLKLDEIQTLVDRLSGTGKILRDRHGRWTHQEIVHSENIIGASKNQITGEETETKGAKIHYSKSGVHIVPVIERDEET